MKIGRLFFIGYAERFRREFRKTDKYKVFFEKMLAVLSKMMVSWIINVILFQGTVMADQCADVRIQLEARKWLYRNRDVAEKLAGNVTEELTASGEFFSRTELEWGLYEAVGSSTPENTGLSAGQISELTADSKRMEAVVKTLAGLVCETSVPAKDKKGRTVYTTREILEAEQNILRQAEEIGKKPTQGQPFGDAESIQAAVGELDAIAKEGSDGKYDMRDEYKEVFNSFLQPSFLQIANGPPGCGKSTLAQGLLYALTKHAIETGAAVPHFYATAPSAKAASGIVDDMEAVGENCRSVLAKGNNLMFLPAMSGTALKKVADTLPRINGGQPLDEMIGNIENMQKGDILVVDEAGLVGAKQMSDLLEKANKQGIRLFMLGDNLQIPPAMAGNGFDLLLDKRKELGIQTTELKIVLRQKDPDEADWTLDIRGGDKNDEGKRISVPEFEGRRDLTAEEKERNNEGVDRTMRALQGYAHRMYTGFDEKGNALYTDLPAEGDIVVPEGATPGLQFLDDVQGTLIGDYIRFRQEYPNRTSVVMATDTREAGKLGEALRKAMVESGLITQEQIFDRPDGKLIRIGIGDTMMLKGGIKGLVGEKNGKPFTDDISSGDQLEVTGIKDGKISFKKGKASFTCDAKEFAGQAAYGLVLPLYEAQGQSKDRAFLAVTKKGNMDKVYSGVAFSRHEQQMSAYVSTRKGAYPDGITGLAKEMREFSTRKQLYSDGKTKEEVLTDRGPETTLRDRLNDLEKLPDPKTLLNETVAKARAFRER